MDKDLPPHIPEEAELVTIEETGVKNLKEILKDVYAIWSEFRMTSTQKSQRAKVAWDHVQNLLKEILAEEKTFLRVTKQRISSYSKEIEDLSKVLGATTKLPEEDESTLVQKEAALRLELDTLKRLKHTRLKMLEDLRSVEAKFCKVLSFEAHQLPPNAEVPTENDLKELKQHINMLKEEKEKRHKKFCMARMELTTIMEVTEMTPETNFEKEILSDKGSFSLTNETFEALDALIKKAQKKKAELEDTKKQLMGKLTVLWKRLNVDEKERADFLKEHADCRVSTITAIKKELEKCEKIKRDNIQLFVTSLRTELEQLWEKCGASSSDKSFRFYYETEMSDDLLELHEAEVEKWKAYYQEVGHILSKIEQRRKLWDLLIVFENKAADPNRFRNRKGNLLQEERDRKKLQKDLPALENNIFQDIEAFESHSGKLFLYRGEDYKKSVTDQWEERINQKENEKLERHEKHRLQVGLVPGTPSKRPLVTTPKSAPSKLLKSNAGMSIFRTPATHTSKVTPHTSAKSMCKPLKPFASKPIVPPKREEKRILRERNQPLVKVTNNSPNGTTYTDFATELNRTSRKSCRSSVLCTKKPGGTRTSVNGSKRKSTNKALRRSMRISKNASKINGASTSVSKTVGLTPARGKLGLPFLI